MYLPYFFLPISLEYIDGCVIITGNAPGSETKIAKGSVVTCINGIDIDELLDAKTKRRNWSTIEYGRSSCMPDLISSMTQDSLFTVAYVTPSGERRTDTLRTTLRDYYYVYDRKGEFIRDLGNGVIYIDPRVESATYKNFKAALGSLQSSRGIVFDLRGYPSFEFDKMLGHFTDKTLHVTMFSTLVSCFPNREHVVRKHNDDTEVIEPMRPMIETPVVFLCDDNAISWAETVLMLVKGYGLGTIIGSHSCGTNGDVTTYSLPIYGFQITAVKAVNTDGSQHHGIGVLPDIEVRPTLEGYRNGRDEVLEAAINHLSDK